METHLATLLVERDVESSAQVGSLHVGNKARRSISRIDVKTARLPFEGRSLPSPLPQSPVELIKGDARSGTLHSVSGRYLVDVLVQSVAYSLRLEDALRQYVRVRLLLETGLDAHIVKLFAHGALLFSDA